MELSPSDSILLGFAGNSSARPAADAIYEFALGPSNAGPINKC